RAEVTQLALAEGFAIDRERTAHARTGREALAPEVAAHGEVLARSVATGAARADGAVRRVEHVGVLDADGAALRVGETQAAHLLDHTQVHVRFIERGAH